MSRTPFDEATTRASRSTGQHSASRWPKRHRDVLVVAGGALLGAMMAGRAGWSAGAAPWLDAMAATEPGTHRFALAALVEGSGPAGVVALLWLCRIAAAAQGALALALAARGGTVGLVLGTSWLLWWPDAVLGLGALGPETLLGGGLALVLGAGTWLERRPAIAAMGAGVGCAFAALAHPVGVVLGLGALLAVGFLPRDARASEGNAGVARTRDVVLPFAAAILLLAALIRLTSPPGGLKGWVFEAFQLLRAPRPQVDAGAGTAWPWVGPIVAWASCLPTGGVAGLLVAAGAVVRTSGRDEAGPAIAAIAGVAILLAGLGLPTPGALWLPAAVAPLALGLAAGVLGALGERALAAADTPSARWFVAVPLVALLGGAALECATLQHGEARAGWARSMGWANDVAGARPATVDRPTERLLEATALQRIRLQPGQPGGVRLLERLGALRKIPDHIRSADAFGAQGLIVPRGGPSLVAAAWRECGHIEACLGERCLISPGRCGAGPAPEPVTSAR